MSKTKNRYQVSIFNLDDYAEHDCGLPETDPWYFWPENIPANAQSLYLQVSLSPLSSNGWRDPPGLIYERILSKGTEEFDGLFGGDPTFNSVPVDFLDIADYEKEYYVRAVVLSPGSEAGVVVPSYSKTVRFVCRPPGASEFTYYPPVEPELLQPPIPHVKLVKYEPIHWERSDWMYLYEVTRQPTWKEISPIFAGNDELVESYPVGQVITLGKPSSDDGSWLSDAWNAITEFFSSIIDYIADVTDWVSAAYADIKADIIEFAASTLPMPPPADEYLEDALTYMVDYGLISIGIPPELPNFDQLTAQGVDYLAASALDMANIPETDWTKEKIAEIGSGVASAMNDAAKTGDAPNPLNWNFVRQWPGGLYRPAYLLLRITNPFDTPTESGVVRGRVFRQLNQADLGVTEIMTLYASFCKSMYFELYRPVDDIRIPRLPPNTTIEIPIYLEEYTGAAYTFCPTTVQQNDFHRMYNFFGEVNFSFSINFDLPPAEQYAEENGMINESGFAWARTSAGFGFVGNPYSSYYP